MGRPNPRHTESVTPSPTTPKPTPVTQQPKPNPRANPTTTSSAHQSSVPQNLLRVIPQAAATPDSTFPVNDQRSIQKEGIMQYGDTQRVMHDPKPSPRGVEVFKSGDQYTAKDNSFSLREDEYGTIGNVQDASPMVMTGVETDPTILPNAIMNAKKVEGWDNLSREEKHELFQKQSISTKHDVQSTQGAVKPVMPTFAFSFGEPAQKIGKDGYIVHTKDGNVVKGKMNPKYDKKKKGTYTKVEIVQTEPQRVMYFDSNADGKLDDGDNAFWYSGGDANDWSYKEDQYGGEASVWRYPYKKGESKIYQVNINTEAKRQPIFQAPSTPKTSSDPDITSPASLKSKNKHTKLKGKKLKAKELGINRFTKNVSFGGELTSWQYNSVRPYESPKDIQIKNKEKDHDKFILDFFNAEKKKRGKDKYLKTTSSGNWENPWR